MAEQAGLFMIAASRAYLIGVHAAIENQRQTTGRDTLH